jgi:SHS2 domain-containing protein
MFTIADCDVQELGHTSEIGLAARASTLADLFRCLAQAMIALTGVAADPQAEPLEFEIDVVAVDLPSLLVDWLNEVLYLHEVAGVVPAEVVVSALSPAAIAATLRGGRGRGAPDLQIKAVTYHQLQIVQDDDHWKAEVFFDI